MQHFSLQTLYFLQNNLDTLKYIMIRNKKNPKQTGKESRRKGGAEKQVRLRAVTKQMKPCQNGARAV